MSKTVLGSFQWREETFGSRPARDPRGRSRPTQRILSLARNGEILACEGGTQAIARAICETCMNAGLIKRFKLEPFDLNEKYHGVDAVPDLLLETFDERLFVVENKSSKFLTAKKLEKCEAVERVINGAGMRYALWSDKWPISPDVVRLLRTMRRAGISEQSNDELRAAQACVSSGASTVQQLRDKGVFREPLLAAVWLGHLHINLFRVFGDQTIVSLEASARGLESALNAPVAAHSWWDSLSRVTRPK